MSSIRGVVFVGQGVDVEDAAHHANEKLNDWLSTRQWRLYGGLPAWTMSIAVQRNADEQWPFQYVIQLIGPIEEMETSLMSYTGTTERFG